MVEIAQSGQRGRKQALDPVCNSAPILSWNNSFQETVASNTTAALTAVSTFSPTDPTLLKITAPLGGIRRLNDFYNGAVLRLNVAGTDTLRRIVDYEYLGIAAGVDNALVRVDTAFPSGVTGNGFIENPTPIPTNTAAPAVIQFFIPGAESITNYYNNYQVELLTGGAGTPATRVITAYDTSTHLATLASATPDDWSALAQANNNFVIRRESPANSGANQGVSASGLVIQLATSANPNTEGYEGSFLRPIQPVPIAPFSTNIAPFGEQRRIIKYIGGDGIMIAIAPATNTFTLSSSASATDGFYIGAFLTDVTAGQTRQITSYTGATRSGTVNVNWAAGVAPGDSWAVRSAFLSSSFSVNPAVGTLYEIEIFSRDNATPFNYSGSIVSSQEAVCYEVELLNLILPNIHLKSERGGRPVFYPYLYVELQNVTASSSSQRDIIYSNNPNSYRMMFRAVLDDTTQATVSPFIKIDGDGMIHNIKFKPNDSFKFSVYSPRGVLFETVAQDFYSPVEPNPLVQISACFSFKRI